MGESAAGRIGTGMLLGMLGFAIVWLAEIPFGLSAVWWERRHGVSHQGYVSARGGMARPEAVPLALLVFVALELLTLPLFNIVYRREEAEADWSALQATHEPRVAEALFEKLATTSHADPAPPSWSYVLYADHPSVAQRVAMARAWAQLHERSASGR